MRAIRTEVGQDHADVVAAATQDGMERVTARVFQGTAREATARFHLSHH